MNLKDIKTFEELKMAKAKFYGKDGEIKKLQEKIKLAPSELKGQIGKKNYWIKKRGWSTFCY